MRHPPANKNLTNLRQQLPQNAQISLILESCVPGSFNGRTGAFEASNPGSNPGPGAKLHNAAQRKSPRRLPRAFFVYYITGSYRGKRKLNSSMTLQLNLQSSIGSHRPRSFNNPVTWLFLNQRWAFFCPLVFRVNFQRSSSHEYVTRWRVDG